jgi:hypothetical protein
MQMEGDNGETRRRIFATFSREGNGISLPVMTASEQVVKFYTLRRQSTGRINMMSFCSTGQYEFQGRKKA